MHTLGPVKSRQQDYRSYLNQPGGAVRSDTTGEGTEPNRIFLAEMVSASLETVDSWPVMKPATPPKTSHRDVVVGLPKGPRAGYRGPIPVNCWTRDSGETEGPLGEEVTE